MARSAYLVTVKVNVNAARISTAFDASNAKRAITISLLARVATAIRLA